MKALKIALFSLLGLLVLMVLAIALLALPGVQRALASRLMGGEPGQEVEIGYLHVGFNRTELRDLDFRQPDASYRIGQLTADLSLTDLLFRREARLGDLVLTGLVVDLSRLEPAEDDPGEPFEGILRQLELPMPLYLNTVRVEGELILPPVGEQTVRGDFQLSGGGFAPGREGQLQLSGTFASPAAGVFQTLGVEGDLTVQQGARGRIERARLLALISGAAAEPGRRETLRADLLLLATEDGESYEARFQRVSAGAAPESDADLSNLIVLDATYRYEEGLLEGRWEIDVDRDQLAVFVGELELPEFAARGGGQFSYRGAGELFDVEGRLDLAIADLGAFSEELRALGGFTLNSRFNLALEEEAFRLEELLVDLRDEEGRTLLEARNHQPIRYDRRAERLEGVREGVELARITLHGLPVEWANLFLGGEEQSQNLLVSGGDLTGQLVVSAEVAGMSFRLAEPLRADQVSVTSGGDPVVSGLSLEAHGSGFFREGRMSARLDPLRVRSGQSLLAVVSAGYDSAAGELETRLEADLPVLLAQPVLERYGNLQRGRAQVQVAVDLSEPASLVASGSLRDLLTRDTQQSLPPLTFDGRFRQQAEGLWEVDLPLRLEGPRPSDLRLSGQVETGREVNRFALALAGERVILDQLTALASAFGTPEDGAPPVDERDEEPFWAGWEGRLTAEIARLELQEANGIEQIQGELEVGSDSLVHSLNALFLDSPLSLDLRLRFLTAEERPYLLNGSIEAPRMAAGDLFRQLQPDRPPTVEGIFGASVEIEGSGRNLPDLIDHVRGQARIRSGGGIIRLLYTENPLAGMGLAAGAFLGALGGEIGAIGQIAGRLSNLPYDELTILAERDEQLNFILRDLTVLSPEMHLRGAGEVLHRPGVEVLRQPMEIELRLGARGGLERSLAAVRVLGEERDDLDYRQMRRPFTIRGTPANPDSAPFYRILVDTVMRFVRPDQPETEEEQQERPLIPQLPLDILRGIRGR